LRLRERFPLKQLADQDGTFADLDQQKESAK
jgi:hypothetical protein